MSHDMISIKTSPAGKRVGTRFFVTWLMMLATSLVASRSASATWSLLGAADKRSVIEPLGSGKGLVCGPQSCAIWDVATGTSTASEPLGVTSWPRGHVRLSDGSVLVVFDVQSSPPRRWNPGSGRWVATAPLPESLDGVHLAVLDDGRAIITGRSQKDGSLRAYVADRDVTKWLPLTAMPATAVDNSDVLPTRSGLVLLELIGGKPRVSRYAARVNAWTSVKLPAGWELDDKPLLTTWGDRAVIVARSISRLDVLLIAPEQTTTRQVAWPPLGDLHVDRLSSFDGSDMLLLGDGENLSLWRKPEEPPLRLARSEIGVQRSLAVIDARHLLGLGRAGALVLATLEGPAPAVGACQGLERYLRQHAADGTLPGAEGPPSGATVSLDVALVGDACRERIHRGDPPEALSSIRRWASQPEPEWRDVGQRFSCATEDPAVLPDVAAWLSSTASELTRAVCIARLPYWPNGDRARREVFQNLVRQTDGIWQIDSAALLAAQTDSVALRNLLVPAVAAGHERRAVGTDDLEKHVCSDLRGASPQRQRLCAEGAPQRPEKPQPVNHTPVPKLALDILAGVAVGGLIAGTYIARDSDVGRGIATASGVLGGAVIGAGIGALPAYIYGMKTRHDDATPVFLIAGSVVGGVLGGIAAYAVSASPSARAPTTAAGLALPFLVVIALPVD